MKSILLVLLLFATQIADAQTLKRSDSVQVDFVSEAPLELISAKSESGTGILDMDSEKFAFKVKIRSFEGFNSPLQKEHFNENYMESDEFPEAIFAGRLLDSIPQEMDQEVTVRVKGAFEVHGMTQERLIEVHLKFTSDGSIQFDSTFDVLLEDHGIDIPRIVYQKIADSIKVTVSGKLI